MCTGLELLLGGLTAAGSVASSLIGAKGASNVTIPAAEVPAVDATAAEKSGATVRVGDGQKDNTTATTMSSDTTKSTDKRVFGKPVGGLGASGLSI